MSKPFYAEYVNHMIRFYVRFPEPSEQIKSVDLLNYTVVKRVLKDWPEDERLLIEEVYRRKDTVADNVYSVCKERKIPQDGVWTIIAAVTKAVAKEREMI